MAPKETKIAVLGLGYVGLPLAVAFSKYYPTIGFDVKVERISELHKGKDSTQEVSEEELLQAEKLVFSNEEKDLKSANVKIVTVPTPIDHNRQPDLTPLIKASEMLGRVINSGDVIIYESTVYPGATEEECIPIVEKVSGLTLNRDFYAGYSPERVNPGDKTRPVTKIMKVTSGSTPDVTEFVDQLYKKIITAGTHKVNSIRVAEASKVIENTQRDVNIALINELAMIFGYLGIDTNAVIEAAATKWNFIKLYPGLVGGHCIGVDPYYLVHKSMSVGHIPDMIRKAREINDGMPRFVVSKLIKAMIEKGQLIKNANVLVLGMTFKENCPDFRNTKVVDLIKELKSYSMNVDVHDPWADREAVSQEYNLELLENPKSNYYDAMVIAVGHDDFKGDDERILAFGKPNCCSILEIKSVLSSENIEVTSL